MLGSVNWNNKFSELQFNGVTAYMLQPGASYNVHESSWCCAHMCQEFIGPQVHLCWQSGHKLVHLFCRFAIKGVPKNGIK